MNFELHAQDVGRRPENRRRAAEVVAVPFGEWPRSEAFFEDLDPAALPLPLPLPLPRQLQG